MNICIIPARGGSKRIPKKNIRDFNGKPVIAYSIEAAIESNLFDRVIVSTDDPNIANIAKEYGAEVPFIRPNNLSGDYIGTDDVVSHAVQWVNNNDSKVEYVCCIYATAPFILKKYLLKGYQLLRKSDAIFSFSVTSFSFPIQRAIKINKTGIITPIFEEDILKRSQDVDEAYHDAGQFYWGRADAFSTSGSLYSGIALPVMLPRYLVQDLDTEEDWERAELMYKVLEQQEIV